MVGIPSGRVSPFNYGMVPGYKDGTPNVRPGVSLDNPVTGNPLITIGQRYIPDTGQSDAASPAPAPGAYGTGFLSRLGIGLLGAANPAVALKAAAPPTLGPQAPIRQAAPVVGDYLRGLVGAAPSAVIPNFAGSGVHLNPAAATVAQAPVPQTDVPAGSLANKPLVAPPMAGGIPSDPMLAARNNIAQVLANPHINFHQAAALLGGLPRQPMPQETAQNSLLYLAQKQHDDETSADALKGLSPEQQKATIINATARLQKVYETIANSAYATLNYEQQQGFGVPY